MGDYNTLANFISWGTSKYKANHYMLILSGAGGGLMNGMAYDELNGNDSLNLEEISYGISAAGVNFDMRLSIRRLWEVLKLRRRCLCVPII